MRRLRFEGKETGGDPIRRSDTADAVDATGVRWDWAVDGATLCAKLDLLSKITQSEMLRGLALFVRAHLPDPLAQADDAAQQLLDLVYYGENRSWLASLAGNVPQAAIREKAADLCVERLRAGADRPWERGLAEMAPAVAGSRIQALAESDDLNLVSRVLVETGQCERVPSRELWPRLLDVAAAQPEKLTAGDHELLRPIGKLLLAASDAKEAQTDGRIGQTRSALAQYLAGLDPTSKLHCCHYPDIASFLDWGEDDLRQKCERMLLESVERDGGDVAYAAEAMMLARSPLLGRLLAAVCAKGNVDQMYEVAEHLGRLETDYEARLWLEATVREVPNPSDFGTVWLRSALGYAPSIEQGWRELGSSDDIGRGLALLFALTLGGDPDGVAGLLWLQGHVMSTILDNRLQPDVEPGRSWGIILFGLYAAAATLVHLPEEAAVPRWKALLEPLKTVPEDRVIEGAMHDYVRWALFGMARLCRAGQLPHSTTASASSRGVNTARRLADLIGQAPSSAVDICQQLNRWAEVRAQHPNWHYRSVRVLALLASGDDPPWEEDQQEAAERVQANMTRAVELGNAGRFCESAEVYEGIVSMLRLVPVWGRERYHLQHMLEFALANAYGFVANGDESAHTATMPHPSDDQAKALAEQHCKTALALALEADQPDLQARAYDLLNKISAIGRPQ